MSGSTTASGPSWLAPGDEDDRASQVHALVVAWSLDEPHRIGEAALLGDDGPPQILGRGGPLPGDEAPRARFARHRPAGVEERPPLAAPGLSRRQLLLRSSAAGVRFERAGRCELRHNGKPADRGLLRAGDVLTVKDLLVFYCARRRLESARAVGSGPGDPPGFGEPDRDGIVGESEAAWRLRAELGMVAPSDAPILVLGPSGSGKELAAHAIHRLSRRSAGPFIARSAAAMPPGILDAELFGNRRDYPNAGMPEREGIVGAADGGTLFLDEIGELGPELQTHLLRVLDAAGEYHRLGESRVRRSDLRFVAATNREAGALKHDFAARFVVRVTVPGLDARREDVPLLARHLLDDLFGARPDLRARFQDEARGVARLAPDFVEALLRWRWSTHARELRRLLWSSIRESPRHYLIVPEEMRAAAAPESGPPPEEPGVESIRDALARNLGNQSKAYADLGLPSRFALYRLMRKHHIDPRAFGK